MKIDILASGSNGNCIAIRSRGTCILVDAGVPKTKIEKRLLEAGIRPDEIKAILITHAHKDHVCGLPLANKYKIPVYASEGEWKDIKNVDEALKNVLRLENCPGIGSFDVIPFRTHHDAYEPLGYVIFDTEADEQCSICLDTGKVDEEMFRTMGDSDIYIIEANHDEDMVQASDYPLSVQGRILSDVGHLSNQQTAEALCKLIRGRGEYIYLTHLSKKNNLPALAEMCIEYALRQKGFERGKHYFLEVV